MIELLIIVGIILVIVCLITRDRTEYKLMRLRSGVINSRAQKQRLVHIYKRIESLVDSTNKSFDRINACQQSAVVGSQALRESLEKIYPLIKEGKLLEINDGETTEDMLLEEEDETAENPSIELE